MIKKAKSLTWLKQDALPYRLPRNSTSTRLRQVIPESQLTQPSSPRKSTTTILLELTKHGKTPASPILLYRAQNKQKVYINVYVARSCDANCGGICVGKKGSTSTLRHSPFCKEEWRYVLGTCVACGKSTPLSLLHCSRAIPIMERRGTSKVACSFLLLVFWHVRAAGTYEIYLLYAYCVS